MGKSNYESLKLFFGKKMKEYRRRGKNISQELLADRIGTDANHISRIERGIHLPTTPTLLKLIHELDIPQEDYLQTAIKIMAKTREHT